MSRTRIDRARLARLTAAEGEAFHSAHPRSAELFAQTSRSFVGGVPMNWMRRWPGGFPLFVAEADGAHLLDVDGNEIVDLCLGDTGAMAGHDPIGRLGTIGPSGQGLTTMLPTEDAIWVGDELRRRFGLPRWQLAMTATDANRFVIRLARHATGRPKILVHNGCYHGTVDEALHELRDGVVVPRAGNIGPPVDPALTTRVVEFNDVDALERELGHGDVALVLAEPALTNIGIVLPEPGYHDALRRLTRETGTLLVIDETHTICVGPGGATAAWGLEPDAFVIGKPIAGGIPAAAFGLRDDFASRIDATLVESPHTDVSGIGGTLTGSALALAAIRTTLSQRLLASDFERMVPLAEAWAGGVRATYEAAGLDWSVQVLGARAEYCFGPAPRDGGSAAAIVDGELEAFLHLWALNRGVLLTPFHNMALMSPATTQADVDRHTEVFASAIDALVS